MGYDTDFTGDFTISPPLTPEQTAYIQKFRETRRMKRDSRVAEQLSDPVREAAGLPVGADGAYFVGGVGERGQSSDESVTNHNIPPGMTPYDSNDWDKGWMERMKAKESEALANNAQPGLWCQWTVDDSGGKLLWDGGEKFCNYREWLSYLIRNFFSQWGRVLNGQVYWSGEEHGDTGYITVIDNVVHVEHIGIPAPKLADPRIKA